MPVRVAVPTVNDVDCKRQQSFERYQALSPLDQQIIQFAAVLYQPMTRAELGRCLQSLRLKDQGKAVIASRLLNRVDRLREAQLLARTPSYQLHCEPLIRELVTHDALQSGFFEQAVKVIRQRFPLPPGASQKGGLYYFGNFHEAIREIRIALYQNDFSTLKRWVDSYVNFFELYPQALPFDHIIDMIFNNPLNPDWLRQLSAEIVNVVLGTLLAKATYSRQPATALLTIAKAKVAEQLPGFLQRSMVEMVLFQGALDDAQQLLARWNTAENSSLKALEGWLAFLRGEDAVAIAHYQAALKILQQSQKRAKSPDPNNFLEDPSGIVFILALLKSQEPDRMLDAEVYANLINRQEHHLLQPGYRWLSSLLQAQQGDLQERRAALDQELPEPEACHSLAFLLSALCLYWLDRDTAAEKLPQPLDRFCQQAAAAGYHWLAVEAATLWQRVQPQAPAAATILAQNSVLPPVPLVDCLPLVETWELCLQALTQLDQSSHQLPPGATQRLAWFLTYDGPTSWQLQAREQKIKTNGEWSKGRIVSPRRLMHPEEFDYLTPQDRRVCDCIDTSSYYERYSYYSSFDYAFNARALRALVGHPLVFWEEPPRSRLELVTGEPELLVQQQTDDRLTLSLSPALSEAADEVILVKETPTRLKVVTIRPEHHRIAEILGPNNALTVPVLARDRVLAAINAIASIVAIQSDIGGGTIAVEAVDSDATPHLHLLPLNDGLQVKLLVQPFGTDGPYYTPGTGGETVIADVAGRRVQTRRDLAQEEALAHQVIAACPSLAGQEVEPGEWQLAEPEQGLEFLTEVRELGDRVLVAWPEGEKLSIQAIADAGAFRMAVRRQQDWFEASGELTLDDQRVLDMQQLLALLDETPSRFIPLGDGQFLALTQSFRKRLEDLRTFSDRQGKQTRLHPLAVPALADFADAIGAFEADQHWREHLQRFEAIQVLEPEVPSTLQAELRDYQVEGFRWLARLAHWGVGACLADDMGLGKTLQALAVILTRAPQGPTLVIAPTSVGANWLSEAQRFAPTLKGQWLGTGDRQALLDQLQPFDLVVCSYGLLQQPEVAEMLAQVEWQTIVLDEAQAIKNSETKRSQAAMQLQGRFKMIATGTPIENHLGELWNLFHFINPGLLGSQKRFNQVFAIPIERYKDKGAKSKLKKLIQPFLLRRTKSQVLDELPSRTEILLPVELSQEEIALYEALRREAVAKLESSEAEAGAKHLQVLAEIMRLRRFCCNPSLVRPELKLSSSKLEAFSEIVEELLANRHKALVFSQFVDHLQILRSHLERENIRYQYLDGSTPVKVRQQRVEAFQAGDGDIFLISLKAGGTGLNLTAADYVIHMDPWWNPAVEDQASDRAHRIGQQRPVTIYRLVAQHTIEEKIVELHQHKRDLADSLLADSDGGGKLSTDELLQLLSER